MAAVTHGLATSILDGHGHGNLDTLARTAVLFAHNHVLRNVHQTTGQVTRVGGAQSGIGQALAGAVRVVEVLQHGQALAEGSLDRTGDVITLGVHNHALHAGQGPDLAHVTGSTGLHDHRNRVVIRVQFLHELTHVVGGALPEFHQAVVALARGQGTLDPVLVLNVAGVGLVAVKDLLLVREHQHVGHGDGHTGAGCPVETSVLHLVHGLGHSDHRVACGKIRNHITQHDLVGAAALTDHHALKVRVVPRQQLVEHDATKGGVSQPGVALVPAVGEVLSLNVRRGTQVRNPHLDWRLEAQHTTVEGHDGLGNRQVHALCRLLIGGGFVGALSTELLRPLLQGEEVQTGHHVQTRHGQRLTGRRGQDVVGGQHQDTRLSLCFR